MEWKPTKNPVGDKAMIFVNYENGRISSGYALREFCSDVSLNDIMNDSEKLIIVYRDSGIHYQCGFWVDGNEWFPIIDLANDNQWYVCEDCVLEDIVDRPEYGYIRDQLDHCNKLVDFVRNDVAILGGDKN